MRSPRLHPLVLATVAALLATASAHAADLVRLGNLKFAHYGAVSYMKELGPKYNLEVKEQIFPKGIDIMPAVVSGDIDIAASALDAAIAGRAQGAPIFVVAGFAKGGVRIVGRKELGIKSVAELKGKKVGVPRGGAQELCLFAELVKAKLTYSEKPGEKDVQLIYLAYADLNGALQNKQIEAMCQSEPQSTQAIAAGYAAEIVKPYDTPIGEPVRSLVMTEKMYRNSDVARRVVECFTEATQKFLADPALAEKYVRENLFKGQLSAEDYKAAMDNAAFTYDITAEHVQTTSDLMVKYGVGKMANPPAAKDYVRLDLLEKAKVDLKIK